MRFTKWINGKLTKFKKLLSKPTKADFKCCCFSTSRSLNQNQTWKKKMQIGTRQRLWHTYSSTQKQQKNSQFTHTIYVGMHVCMINNNSSYFLETIMKEEKQIKATNSIQQPDQLMPLLSLQYNRQLYIYIHIKIHIDLISSFAKGKRIFRLT